jgi:antirestriction protein ArdC
VIVSRASRFECPVLCVLCRYRHNTHSTGSQKRLAREGICEAAPFGSAVYSKEELCAEMGAAYLCAEAGIAAAVIENQAAYVAGWLKKLRNDRKLVIHAAAQAQHAADYILGRRESCT